MDEDRVDQDPATQTKVAFALHHRGVQEPCSVGMNGGLLALFMRIFAGGITLDSIDGCQSFSYRQRRAVRLVARLSFRSVWLSD